MTSAARRDWIDDTRRVVVKIGSRVLVDENHLLDVGQVASLARQMASIRAAGREVICVSSGAVAAGLSGLGLRSRPTDLPSTQAAAAVGQARLIGLYRQLFGEHDIAVAQVLLTHDDMRSRERHLNARNTFSRLLRSGVTPIVNENDTVAIDEIRVGDNDLLSSLVACLVRADLLVMLTNADGLLSRPPSEDGVLIEHVEQITDETYAMVGDHDSPISTGGMKSKLDAAAMVTRAGERCVIANGRTPDVLPRLFNGENLGTVFEPSPHRLRGRKRWIAFFDHPRGDLCIDDGAAHAIGERGKSLLPVGIKAVTGRFERGAPVRIVNEAGQELARGLVNFSSEQLQRIVGRQTGEASQLLDGCGCDEVVHRDNLVVR